jgi:amino acid transporter
MDKTDENVPSSAKIGQQGRFRKVLGFQELYFISLAGIIGSAWLFGSIYGASKAGPAAIISWMISGVFVIFLALTWAEIGGMLPSAGASVRIPQYAHGQFTGFYFGWAYYISAVTVAPVEAIAIVTYASAYLPSLISNGALTTVGYLASIAIMILTFLINSFGVKFFARLNTVITWWKLAIPILTIIVALLYFYPPNFSAFGGFAPMGISPIFSAIGTAGIVFAFMGFRESLDYSGEAKNPRKDVPLAIILSVVTTIIVYTLLQLSFIGGLRWGASGLAAGDWANLATKGVYASAPFYHLMAILGIPILAIVLLVDAVISPFGTVGVYTGSSARDLFALVAGGHLHAAIGEVNKKYGIPRRAMLVNLIVGTVFIFLFPSWGPLATVVTTTTVFTQLAGATSLIVLRKHAPELKRGFKLPFANVMALLAFVMASLIVYWTTWPYTAYAFLAILIGVAVFFATKVKRGSFPYEDVKRGLWIVVYSLTIIAVSYLGSYGIDYIKFPLDFCVVAIMSVIFFFWGVRSGYETPELRELKKQEQVSS